MTGVNRKQNRSGGTFRDCQSGFALVMVLFMVVLLAIIGITLNRTGGLQITLSHNLNAGEEAYYIAQAGIQHVMFMLMADPSLRGSVAAGVPFGTGSYTVSVSDSTSPAGNILISSTGTRGTVSRTIEKRMYSIFTAYPPLVMDTTMNETDQHFNYGISPYIKLGYLNNNSAKRGLLKFDLSSIPPNAVIVSAVFELYMYDRERIVIGNNTLTVEVHRINPVTWIEGVQDGATCTVGASWLRYDCSKTWKNPNFEDIAETSTAISYDDMSTWHQWNITSLVDIWYTSPSQNYGMRLKDQLEENNAEPFVGHFYSGEYSDVSLRPKLTVYYSIMN